MFYRLLFLYFFPLLFSASCQADICNPLRCLLNLVKVFSADKIMQAIQQVLAVQSEAGH